MVDYQGIFEERRKIVHEWISQQKQNIQLFKGLSITFDLRGSYFWELNHLLSDIDIVTREADINDIEHYYIQCGYTVRRKFKQKYITYTILKLTINIAGLGNTPISIITISQEIDDYIVSTTKQLIMDTFHSDKDKKLQYILAVMNHPSKNITSWLRFPLDI